MARQNEYNPITVSHPGETLAEKLEEVQMAVKEFALRTGKPEKTIHAVLKGYSSITSDMAVQFEQVTKIPANFWMNYQARYDEHQARVRQGRMIDAAVEWTKQFPVAALARLGWIERRTTWKDKADELLKFFGFVTHKAWKGYYLSQNLKAAFRISLASTSKPFAISAWLRMGELQASDIHVGDYDERKLKDALPVLKEVMAKHPKDFFDQLKLLCAQAGIKVVFTPCLPKAPINGCTRWIGNNPVIQLTDRYKRNDIFWFTFFHEIGHIILHGKKDVFLELDKDNYTDQDVTKEQEADDFSIERTLSAREEKAIVDAASFGAADIIYFADRFNTHPAIIVGRLQRNGLIPHSRGREFIEKIELADSL